MVNQSQIDQLLDLYEHGGSGQGPQANDPTQSGAQIETEELQSNSSATSDGPGPDIAGLRTKEEDELFELCQEIQNIVSETDTDPIMTDTNFDKVFISIEDEKPHDVIDVDALNTLTDTSPVTEPQCEVATPPCPTAPTQCEPHCGAEQNIVDYNDEETNCVMLPDDLLDNNSQHSSVPLADELLDSIEADKDIDNSAPSCPISDDYTDLFSFKDFDPDSFLNLDDSYQHPIVTDQPLQSASISTNSSSVDIEDWDLMDLFPSLTSV